MVRAVILGAVILGFLGAAAQAASNPDAVAVIIGNRNYQGRVPDVDYAHRDADAIRAYVVDVLGYDEDNIIYLRDATKAQLETTFGNFQSHKGKLWRYIDPAGGSDITIFYSGHGVPGQRDGRGYLLPSNADPDTAELNGYPIDLLYQNLGKLETRSVTVMLDACFSGDSPQGMLIRSASPVFIKSEMPQAAGLGKRADGGRRAAGRSLGQQVAEDVTVRPAGQRDLVPVAILDLAGHRNFGSRAKGCHLVELGARAAADIDPRCAHEHGHVLGFQRD